MSTYATPIPGGSGYAGAALNATTAYNNALARINEKRSGTMRQYGYLADINPQTGVTQNMRVDPNNQYGNLQQMLRSQGQGAQEAEYTNQERGVRGGLANKLFSRLKYDWGGQSAQLGQSLTGTLGGYQDEQNQAAYERDRALWEAEQAAALEAIMNGWFNPAGGSESDGGGGNDHNDPQDPGAPFDHSQDIVRMPPKYSTGNTDEPLTMNQIVRARPALTSAAKIVSKAKKKKK